MLLLDWIYHIQFDSIKWRFYSELYFQLLIFVVFACPLLENYRKISASFSICGQQPGVARVLEFRAFPIISRSFGQRESIIISPSLAVRRSESLGTASFAHYLCTALFEGRASLQAISYLNQAAWPILYVKTPHGRECFTSRWLHRRETFKCSIIE